MTPLAHHVTLRLAEDRIIAPTPESRRRVARSVLGSCQGEALLAFACVDTHLHILLGMCREAARERTRRIAISLQRRLRLGSGFEPSRVRPIDTVWHLRNALSYVLLQGKRHGLSWEAYFEASNLPDLLGMRPLGSFTQTMVQRFLPRLRRQVILEWVGMQDLVPAKGPLERLPEAARRAAALGSLLGRDSESLGARRSMLALAGPGLNVADLASILGVSRRSVFRLAQAAPDQALVEAIELWLGWMNVEGRTIMDAQGGQAG